MTQFLIETFAIFLIWCAIGIAQGGGSVFRPKEVKCWIQLILIATSITIIKTVN
jgi:hypothetical protein